MTHWLAYVDESGDSALDEVFVVGGLLMPAPFDSLSASAALQQAAPEMPWPPHARCYNRLSPWALWARPAPWPGAIPTSDMEAALTLWRSSAPTPLAAVESSLLAGREPNDADLAVLDDVLYSDPALVSVFTRRRRAFRTALIKVLGRARDEGAVAFGVIDGPERIAGERYLPLLGLALARALALAGRGGARQVGCEILTRDVRNGVLGRDAPLMKSDVFAATRSETAPVGPPAVDQCRLLDVRVRPWDERTPAALVLADNVANRLRRILGKANSLETIRRLATADLGLDVVLFDRPSVLQKGPPFNRPWAIEASAM
jgi:hypothetical protein